MSSQEELPSTLVVSEVEAEAIARDSEDHMTNAVALTDDAEFLDGYVKRHDASDAKSGVTLADVAELDIAAPAEAAFSQADATFDHRIKQYVNL